MNPFYLAIHFIWHFQISKRGGFVETEQIGGIMKRDMDLIRKILIRIEKYPHFPEVSAGKPEIPMEFDEYSQEEVYYNLNLLSQAGLVNSDHGNTYSYRFVHGLTWQGHEFLDLMKKDTLWKKAKDAMKETGGMAFQVLMRILIETATRAAMGQLQ